MKVNLLIDNPNVLSDYLNLDPCMSEGGDARIKADISDLDEYVEDNECEELRVHNVLTYFDSNKVDNMLNNWIKKLRLNGKISVSDVDIEQVFKAYQRCGINLLKLNELLFGHQSKKWDFKKCGLSMIVMEEALKAKGLTITKKYFENYNFVIEAQRNGY